MVKNLPAMWETQGQSLGWEDPLEKEGATHSSIVTGEFHGPYSPWGRKELDTTEYFSFSSYIVVKIYLYLLKNIAYEIFT